ncbi:hypothetical protein AMECASPLE_014520 [Ameca splendens]|uniref:Interleukin n=1 Tax=Ameca splendens TaxID=208324 RepID=A0ABV1A7Y8_9TELE
MDRTHTGAPSKSDLFQSTWKLCCRDSHKTQVWLCFFTLSLLTLCNCDISPTESRDLQKCLGVVRATIEKSDAMLYTPSNYDVTDRCKQKMLRCYMLELMVILEEEETGDKTKQCIFHFNHTLQPETSCPECEIYPLQNSTIFFDRLVSILQKIAMSQSNTV